MKETKYAIKIDRGVPLPETKWHSKNPLVLAMEKMKDGDSFEYPLTKRTMLSYCASKAGIVIATRIIDQSTLRVWRIKERPKRNQWVLASPQEKLK